MSVAAPVIEPGVAVDVAPVPAPVRPQSRDERRSYGKTAKVGALWGIGREAVGQALAIPTALMLARLLSPTDFGIAAAATFFVQLAKKMGNMGLNTALVRMKDVREEHRASVFFLNVMFCIAAWIVLMATAPSIGAMYGDERVTLALWAASMIFLVNFFGTVEYAILQREMKFKEMALIEWITPLIFFPVALAMAWFGYGYWSLIVGHLVANAVSTMGKVYFGGWRPSLKVTRRGLAETVPFGAGVYAKRLLMYAAENLDSLIVGSLFGVTALGYYDKAYNTVSNLGNRMSFGANVVFRIFSIIRDDRARFVRAYNKAVLASTFVTIPVLAGLIVAAPEFIVAAFGDQWLPAVLPFRLLCLAAVFRFMSGNATAVVQASGQVWSEVWRRVVYVALMVALLFLFRRWGIAGAAVGVLTATVVAVLLMQRLVGRILGLDQWELIRPLVPGITCALGVAAVVGGVTAICRSELPAAPVWVVFGLQAAAGGVFWALFSLFGRFRSLQEVVREVVEDVFPKPLRRLVERFR